MEAKKSSYSMYKGLQMPLVFLYFKGKYIYWAIGALAGGIFVMVAVLLITGKDILAGISWLVSSSLAMVFIGLKQNKGLYNKKIQTGVFIVENKMRLKHGKKEQ